MRYNIIINKMFSAICGPLFYILLRTGGLWPFFSHIIVRTRILEWAKIAFSRTSVIWSKTAPVRTQDLPFPNPQHSKKCNQKPLPPNTPSHQTNIYTNNGGQLKGSTQSCPATLIQIWLQKLQKRRNVGRCQRKGPVQVDPNSKGTREDGADLQGRVPAHSPSPQGVLESSFYLDHGLEVARNLLQQGFARP